MNPAPHTISASNGRDFATFPVAVLALVANQKEEFLLLKRPAASRWEVPTGALEAGETPLHGLLRELDEELGTAVRYRVVGPVDISAFRLDDKVTHMLSLGFLVQYLGGEIIPGDDMSGAQQEWMSLESLRERTDIAVPSDVNPFGHARDMLRYNLK